jgi:hypothetical protein
MTGRQVSRGYLVVALPRLGRVPAVARRASSAGVSRLRSRKCTRARWGASCRSSSGRCGRSSAIHRGILRFVGFDVLAPHVVHGPVHLSDAERKAALEGYARRLVGMDMEKPIDAGRYCVLARADDVGSTRGGLHSRWTDLPGDLGPALGAELRRRLQEYAALGAEPLGCGWGFERGR